ncbi:hypothetical protein EUTSA_v10020719mg [Eutrema salsugineum]|uniref:Jacalin-type lectin domain-containing protein n=2 Tax=Eutrema TaxID=98005 RepID=V4M0F4_EUTSA|nr:jacalin-related lectin 35 [Eutrema salsugineum]ESQ48287.1 hypothetical protein EUTSA_v10020719mg [Eutrema salsugineum]
MAQKLEAQGGRGGELWDDGGVYDNVKKVYVGQGDSGVVYVKFDYEKDGNIVSREHGKKSLLGTEEFELDPEDYITSVKISYEKLFGTPTEIITALVFKTFKGKTSQPFGMVSGQEFELGGGKIVGFHGSASDVIHSLGAYIASSTTPVTPPESGGTTKLEAQGGRGGEIWDDGGAFENVKKVYVGQGDSGVVYVKFDYEKDGKIVSREHGKKTLLGTEEFELDSDDYITSVKVYYEKLFGTPTEIITALIFKTFKGKTSQPFGMTSGEETELGVGKIVGFHGTASDVIHSLGAYIVSSSTPVTPSNTIPAQGGDAGVAWDDGVHDGVKKIYVGQGDSSVTYFKAEYEKASKPVIGSDHGKKSLLGAEEFVLEAGEYVTAVTGYYDKIYGVDAPAIISLQFTTNKKTSIPYGMESGTKFVLEKKDHKIVGFYGQAGEFLYKIGVKVAPIAN